MSGRAGPPAISRGGAATFAQGGMSSLQLTSGEAEHILAGGELPDRRDLAAVLALTAFMRATREVEPAPPMRADLIHLIDGDAPAN
jgi:hypothetical protein